MPRITIQNEARTIDVPLNANLREALLSAKAPLYGGFSKLTNCRGRGFCGTCNVIVIEGAEHLSPRTPAEHKKLQTYDVTRRLACQTAIVGDNDITVNTEIY